MGRALDLAQTRELATRSASKLSGDQPLSNLDAKLRAEMRLEIKELQRALGITSAYVRATDAPAE